LIQATGQHVSAVSDSFSNRWLSEMCSQKLKAVSPLSVLEYKINVRACSDVVEPEPRRLRLIDAP